MTPQEAGSRGFAGVVNGLIFAAIATLNLFLFTRLTGQDFDDSYQQLAVITFISVAVLFSRYSLIWQWHVGRAGSIGTRVLVSWVLLASVLIFTGFLTRQSVEFQRRLVLMWVVSTPLAFMAAHHVLRYVTLNYFPGFMRARSTVIVFMNPASRRLARTFERLEMPRFNLLGYFDDRPSSRTGGSDDDKPLLGSSADVAAYVNAHRVEVVFVVLPLEGSDRAMSLVTTLGDTTASVYYVPASNLFQLDHMQFSEVGGIPVLTVTETPFFGADGVLKRIMDIVFASALLICLAPLFALVALLVLATSGAPIFFTQRRYGLDGAEIPVHKFRTMTVAEDGDDIRQACRGDARITRIGAVLRKTSIDEWPQFWNVLCGHMSLVGPRPHAVRHNEEYRSQINGYMVRHKVKPGLTGLAQIKGLRGETRTTDDMKRRVEMDIDYIQSWSPGLDIYIILRTVWIVFRDRAAY